MTMSFSIARGRFTGFADTSLLAELRSRTGSDDEAASILGCIERLGDDPSIQHYEMTPRKTTRTYRGAPPVAWVVRAVRHDES
jgi:hypothetical protein